MSDMTPEMLEEAKAYIKDCRDANSWSWGDKFLIDALAYIDAQQRTIEEKEAEVARLREVIQWMEEQEHIEIKNEGDGVVVSGDEDTVKGCDLVDAVLELKKSEAIDNAKKGGA